MLAFEACKNQFHKQCVRLSISLWKDLVLWQSLYKYSLVATETHPFIAACCCFVKRGVHRCADLGDTEAPGMELVLTGVQIASWVGELGSGACLCRCLEGQGGAVLSIGRASGTQP